MNKKLLFGLLIIVLAVFPVLTACPAETTPTPAATPTPKAATPTPTVEANWWDKFGEPVYGGTLTERASTLADQSWDPAVLMSAEYAYCYMEPLFGYDWTLDRNIWPFQLGFIPEEYWGGLLAESWEQTDPLTVTVHIRQEAHWQDKPPVNGREFTAEDVQFTYDRLLGTGSGFTEPNPFYRGLLSNIERVTATDKYTVEIKLKQAGALAILQVLGSPLMMAREVVELYGQDPGDMGNAVGTGAWMLKEFITGSSVTFSANPSYWGTDERYPGNQLPYCETLKVVAIPEMPTAIAALRTGRIDSITGTRGGLTLQEAATIAEGNPDMQLAMIPEAGATVDLRCDHEPFTDIRVRKALQMAIDRKTIAQTHYLGKVDGTPCVLIAPTFEGYCFAYKDWPKELQEEYSYNPERAEELLAEAGYPDGFETNCYAASNFDLDLLQIIQSYFSDIGVDMEIKVLEFTAFMPFVSGGKQDQMAADNWTGTLQDPGFALKLRHSSLSGGKNHTFNNDPHYDALVEQFIEATDVAEAKKVALEADRYAIEQHWSVNLFPVVTPIAWQPYLKGYSGERTETRIGGWLRARFWIDQELKESMGY